MNAKTEKVSARVKPETKEKVLKKADAMDTSESWVVNQALEKYFEPQPRKPQVSTD